MRNTAWGPRTPWRLLPLGAVLFALAGLLVVLGQAADHRDGPIFGPPGITITNSRRDINDVYVFRSPANANNTVLILDVSPFAGPTTPPMFDQAVIYDFKIANRDLITTTDDITFRVTFSAPDAQGVQEVTLRGIPAAKFPGTGGILARGPTGVNLPVRGAGGGGAQFHAGIRDDPFRFDAVGFNLLLNNATAVAGVQAGQFPRGTSPNGFGPGSTPNFDAPNFFGPSVNTLAIAIELPSAVLRGASGNVIGVWCRTELNGVQLDRMGRPAINTALIPPVPRGATFPIGGTMAVNRQERRNAFNAGLPKDDRATFRADMVSVLTAFYPAGRPGGNPSAAQAGVLADLLLPDILVFDTTSAAGFGAPLSVGGTTFLGNGRKLSDDVISTELAVLTDDDLPAAFGGGPNPPVIVTQNVKDDNGQNLKDGSTEPPPPQGNGAAGTGTVRGVAFPYIGSANNPATGLPGPPPPP